MCNRGALDVISRQCVSDMNQLPTLCESPRGRESTYNYMNTRFIPSVAKSLYEEKLNKANLANTTKRNNSTYKEVYISAELEPIFKEILFYCKTGLYS